MKKYTNRYNDTFIFELDEDKNVIWSGIGETKFKWCRFGWPNVYKVAYEAYCKDVGSAGETPMHIEQFKEEVHNYIYDEEGKYVGPGEIANKYATLIYSDKDNINMVDPSGGPYMTADMDLGEFLGEEFEGLCIRKFEPMEDDSDGWKIITYNKYEHLAEYTQIGGIISTKAE